MALPPSLLVLLASSIPTIAASPILSERYILNKRSSLSRNIGIGFAIAIPIVIFASIIVYLGVQRGWIKPWLCWRKPVASLYPISPSEKVHGIDTDTLKSRISSPIQIHSSALPELSPVVTQPTFAKLSPVAAKPSLLDLSATQNAVPEMDLPSPRRPPSVVSTASKSFYSSRKSSIATVYRKSIASVKVTGKNVYSSQERPPKVNSWFDRQSWFCRGAMEIEDEEKRVRGVDTSEGVAASVTPPATAVIVDKRETEKRNTMDWSGMEWLTKVYNERSPET